MPDLVINSRVTIPAAELTTSFVRSGGPGGQNVNKTSTQAQIRWNVRESATLSETERGRLLTALASRLTTEGELVLSAQETRSQAANLEAGLARLTALVAGALVVQRSVGRPNRLAARSGDESKRKSDGAKRKRTAVVRMSRRSRWPRFVEERH